MGHQRHRNALTVIGIDCAVSPRNVGLVLGVHDDGPCIVEVSTTATWEAIETQVAAWIGETP